MPKRSEAVNGIGEMVSGKLIDPRQCRLARAGLGLSQDELATAVGVSDRTILGFEKTGKISQPARRAIRAVLEGKGARFVEAEGEIGVLIPAA